MLTMKIPYAFVAGLLDLSWRDIDYGLERQLISPKVAIELAADRLGRNASVTPEEIALAALPDDAPVIGVVKRLASTEPPCSVDEMKSRWLYIALRWLFENRTRVGDPLSLVDEMYADFEYPEEIASFVRYMPMVGPDLGSREKNEARLYEYWKAYLDQAARRFHKL